MKKYEFRLETLLKIRSILEDEAERMFREAIVALTDAVSVLDGLRQRTVDLLNELAAQRQKGIDLNIQSLYDEYYRHLRHRIEEQTVVVAKAEELVEQRREELMEAMKERKTIENLRVKDYDRYLLELKQWEQGIIDDLSVLRSANPQLKENVG